MFHPTIGAPVAQPQSDFEGRWTLGLYARARNRSRRGQLWSSLMGRSRSLFGLESVRASCKPDANCAAELRTVAIAQILGSEERSTDFDRDFSPLWDHNRERWLGIARARQQGKTLPPVMLIQIGDVYFVRDGHHRISVERARGQETIKARVTIWQVTGPLPWETAAPAGQPFGVVGVLHNLQGEGARLATRTRLNTHAILGMIKMALRSPAAP